MERTVVVCGAGLMGHGIAQVLAGVGANVRLYEPDLGRAQAGVARIAGSLDRAVVKGKLDHAERSATLARVAATDDLQAAAAGVDLAIEAIVEDEAAKRSLFAVLDAAAPPAAIFATNTSSIPITRLADAVAPARRPRMVGMHFFSPVPVMPLVELIRGADTDDATVATIRATASDLGKQLIVSRDRPGFIVNRILMPFLVEAMLALEEGLGTARDIDTGAKVGLGHPMGPLELADFIGLDVCVHIMEVMADGLGDTRYAPPASLRALVAAGRLGQKTGHGFHRYPRE
jgi:3-hydroxybutyryl-CoA dehydrogenase